MSDEKPQREVLKASIRDVIATLPEMGRVMVATNAGGATHERIGNVETVIIDGAYAKLSGACHDSQIDLAMIASVIADRSGRMRDKMMPKLEMQDRNGVTLFSIHVLDGPELFEKALARFGDGRAVDPAVREPSEPGSQDVPADDIGAATLQAVLASGVPVTIEMRRIGLVQAWDGALPEAKPMMGFVNIISKDFHLHLKAGAVTRWRKLGDAQDVELHAEGADGAIIGLVLRGQAAAFANVSHVLDMTAHD
jgi:putative heme degradation protein